MNASFVAQSFFFVENKATHHHHQLLHKEIVATNPSPSPVPRARAPYDIFFGTRKITKENEGWNSFYSFSSSSTAESDVSCLFFFIFFRRTAKWAKWSSTLFSCGWWRPKRIVSLSLSRALFIRLSFSLFSLSPLRVLILVRVIGASSRDGGRSSGHRGNDGRVRRRGGGAVAVQFGGLPTGQQRG